MIPQFMAKVRLSEYQGIRVKNIRLSEYQVLPDLLMSWYPLPDVLIT